MPEVTFLPNRFRPGVGKPPHRESRRPTLPQIAVHCPPLAAGSALGYLVYPALAEGEAFQIRYLPDGRYLFSFFVRTHSGEPVRAFSLSHTLSGVAPGQWTEDLVYQNADHKMDDAAMFQLRDALFSSPNLGGAIAGSVGLLGAANFTTPGGWDTIYTGVLNNPSPSCLPVLTVRVETDWFSLDTEFRYVLQPGDSIGAGHGDPIGQVFFVSREAFSLRAGSARESASFQESFDRFQAEKRADQMETSSKFKYSPVYTKRMKGPK